jgi:hypothetical protein
MTTIEMSVVVRKKNRVTHLRCPGLDDGTWRSHESSVTNANSTRRTCHVLDKSSGCMPLRADEEVWPTIGVEGRCGTKKDRL